MNFINLRSVKCFYDSEKEQFLVIDEYGNDINIPKKSFDRTYKSIESNMTFSEALFLLKSGYNITRKRWFDDNVYLIIMHSPRPISIGDDQIIAHDSYIAIKTKINTLSPYNPSSDDLMSDDWIIF